MRRQSVLASLIFFLLFPVLLSGEGKVFTKKVRLADFTTKTTKVVLSGSALWDANLKNEVTSRWHISPYEFCSVEEYESLKNKPGYYFLRTVMTSFGDESGPGLVFLSLIKGGKEKNPDSMDQTFEVVGAPIASAGMSSGREFIFLGAVIDVFQDFVLDAMASDRQAYAGLKTYNYRLRKSGARKIFISESDLGFQFSPELRNRYLNANFRVVSEDEADMIFQSGEVGSIVSFTVAPQDAGASSYCYKMLIDAGTHELIYYKRHLVTNTAWKGFLLKDIKAISSEMKKR